MIELHVIKFYVVNIELYSKLAPHLGSKGTLVREAPNIFVIQHGTYKILILTNSLHDSARLEFQLICKFIILSTILCVPESNSY